MKIPGISTILLYQLKNKEKVFFDESFKEFASSDLHNNKWIFDYFAEDLCKKRWADGSKMYYLMDSQSTACSFVWSKNNTEHFFGEFNRKLIFPFQVNFLYDAITPVKHRGKGYYPLLLRKAAMINSDNVSIGYAAPSNIPSNKGILKAGFELTHKINRILDFVKITNLNKSTINFYATKDR